MVYVGPARRRPDPLECRARRVRQHRPGGAGRQAPRAHARGHRLRDPARATQRPRLRDPRAADARRRLRHHLHRHHRIQADRAGAARGQADARAARRASARASCRPRSRRSAPPSGSPRRPTPPRRASSRRRATTCCSRSTPRGCSPRRSRNARRTRPCSRSPAASTARCAPPRKCSTTCSTSRGSRAARMRTEIIDFDLAEMFADLERQFAPLAARRGLRLRVTRPPLPRAQRPRAAAPRAAEPDLERVALHAARRRAGRLPAARRLGRAVRLGHRPRHPGAAPAARDLRRVPPPRPALALGRAGPRPRAVDLRPHRAAARHATRPALAARPRLGVPRARAARQRGRPPSGHAGRGATGRRTIDPGRPDRAVRRQRARDPRAA